jgi:integrase/recombinase XerD
VAPQAVADPNAARRDFEGLKAAYLQHGKLRNLLPLSLRQMEQALRFFIGFIEARGVKEIGEVDAALFEDYKAQLMTTPGRKGIPLHVNTVRDRLFIVQRWFVFLRKRGYIFFDPIAGVQVPKIAKALPRGILQPHEIQKLMAQPDLRSFIGYRDRTMMELLYATGVRSGELVSLNVQDVDFERKTVRVRFGKGGKERFVPLSTPCCRFLERYLRVVRPELIQCLRPAGNNWKKKAKSGGDLLFLSIYGGPFNRTWVGTMMRRYLAKAGIMRDRISPVHGFRHSVATHLLENGMDIRYVQTFLGHDSIASTQIYAHVERKTLHRLFKSCHPRAMIAEEPQPFKEKDHAAAA